MEEAADRSAEDAEWWTLVEGVAARDGQTAETDCAREDSRLEEVVSLVRSVVPGASVRAIREYLQMLDDRREAKRKLAVRSLIERLPDPKPATLGRRLGPDPSSIAETIIDLLRHERP